MTLETELEIGATVYIKGRPWRHGYRVEGSYIERKFGKYHLFFQNEKEAMKTLTEGVTSLTSEKRKEEN